MSNEARKLYFERLRKQRQERIDRLADKDYLPSDAGEPPKGVEWN